MSWHKQDPCLGKQAPIARIYKTCDTWDTHFFSLKGLLSVLLISDVSCLLCAGSSPGLPAAAFSSVGEVRRFCLLSVLAVPDMNCVAMVSVSAYTFPSSSEPSDCLW